MRRLKGSELIKQPKDHVQDPYSLRCIPQVHGASKSTLDFCRAIIENEINAVTDNPTIFPDDDEIISAGNFHGQPLALALDYLSIALSELGSISERRTYKLISGDRGLPPFLVKNPRASFRPYDRSILMCFHGKSEQTTLYSCIGRYH